MQSLSELLRLQEAEGRRRGLEKELQQSPRDCAAVEQLIMAECAAIEAGRQAVRERELKSKQLEAAIRAAEERATKLKSQQLLVKKNDEYQALGREIESADQESAKLQEDEIALLYQIDEERGRQQALEAARREAIRGHEQRLEALRRREAELRAKLAEAEAAVAAARSAAPEAALRQFERVLKAGRFPVLVELVGHNCGGCHMKVSAGVEQELLKGQKLVECENCGRLLRPA